ncbi:hypothetical protein Hanom_Chr11g00981841 [Helianthus anomalus]
MNVTRFIHFYFPFRYSFAFRHVRLSIHSLVKLQHCTCIIPHSQGTLLLASILNRNKKIRAYVLTYWHTIIHTHLHPYIYIYVPTYTRMYLHTLIHNAHAHT